MKSDGYADHVAMGDTEYEVEVTPHWAGSGWSWDVSAVAYNLETEEEEMHTYANGWSADEATAERDANAALLRARSEVKP